MIFGVPLETLMKNGAVPAFLVQATSILETCACSSYHSTGLSLAAKTSHTFYSALGKRGIFPVGLSPSTPSVTTALRSRFTLHAVPDFSGLDAETVAVLLVTFLEELVRTGVLGGVCFSRLMNCPYSLMCCCL